MIILDNNGKKIEFKIEDKIRQTTDRRNWTVTVPKIICTSRTDAEKMQEYVNTFVYNLVHELLDLDTKLTLKETKLAEIKEEPKTKVKKEK
ncbi:MAG: hypothetical protein K2P14_03630 [Anaeroplasmataceae bacterium]|nr:hypothetical protein [Anaeroplasmataceae bacterium]